MYKVTLCDGKYDGTSIFREAYLKDGQLHIDGQDLGASVSEFWGNSEYEYFYSFSSEMTSCLHDCLKKDSETADDLLALVFKYFSGNLGDIRLREYCKDKQIVYDFYNHF
jgi:hypothetical protein